MAPVPATQRKLTYEDYENFPEDGNRHEVLDGVHVVTPPPNVPHQVIVTNLAYLLTSWTKRTGAGRLLVAPTGVELGPHDAVEPDLLFVATEHMERFTKKHLKGAPDLAIEVLSPSTRRRDLTAKREAYARSGVREYWVVDPEAERIEVFRATGPTGDDALEKAEEVWSRPGATLTSPLLPGLVLSVPEVFE